MRLLIDESMPRSLTPQLVARGFIAQDVRDIGLKGKSDTEIFSAAVASDAIIITRDKGFIRTRIWPAAFTAGVIAIDLPDNVHAHIINAKVIDLLTHRQPDSLLGAVTIVESYRALSRIVRRR